MFNERKSIRRLVFYWIAIFLFVGSGHLHAIPVPELTNLGVSSGAPIFALLSSLFVSFLYRIRRLISFKKFLILLLLFFLFIGGLRFSFNSIESVYNSAFNFKVSNTLKWEVAVSQVFLSEDNRREVSNRISSQAVYDLMISSPNLVQMICIQEKDSTTLVAKGYSMDLVVSVATPTRNRFFPIEGIVHVLPHELVENPSKYLSPSKINVIWCNKGSGSAFVTKCLIARTPKSMKIYYLDGGISGWREQKLPILESEKSTNPGTLRSKTKLFKFFNTSEVVDLMKKKKVVLFDPRIDELKRFYSIPSAIHRSGAKDVVGGNELSRDSVVVIVSYGISGMYLAFRQGFQLQEEGYLVEGIYCTPEYFPADAYKMKYIYWDAKSAFFVILISIFLGLILVIFWSFRSKNETLLSKKGGHKIWRLQQLRIFKFNILPFVSFYYDYFFSWRIYFSIFLFSIRHGTTDLIFRSSSVDEDTETSSKAGHYESFRFNLFQMTEVVLKIKQLSDFNGAYFLQPFLSGLYSGVLVTSHPMHPNSLLIEYSGIPMNVTLGKTTDMIYVSRFDLRFDNETLTSVECENFYELSVIAMSIERYFKKPQNIEWVIDNSRIYILQTRDIIFSGSRAQSQMPLFSHGIHNNFSVSVINEQLYDSTVLNVSVFLDIWSNSGSLGVLESKKLIERNDKKQPFLVFEDGKLHESCQLKSMRGLKNMSCRKSINEIYTKILPDYYRFLMNSQFMTVTSIWDYFLVNVYPFILAYGFKAELLFKTMVDTDQFSEGEKNTSLFNERFGRWFRRKKDRNFLGDMSGNSKKMDFKNYNLYDETTVFPEQFLALIPIYQSQKLSVLNVKDSFLTKTDLSYVKNDLNRHVSIVFEVLRFKIGIIAKNSGLNQDIKFLTVREIDMVETAVPWLLQLIQYRKDLMENSDSEGEKCRAEGLNSFGDNRKQLRMMGSVISGSCSIKGTVISSEMLLNEELLPSSPILVTRFLHSSLIPKLSLVKGIVSETGNFLSHWAIIAREENIVGVINCNRVSMILEVGQEIEVKLTGEIEVIK